MKKLLQIPVYILYLVFLGFFSCKKDLDGDQIIPAPSNKPPVANAGADLSTVLPKDSVVLDGTASKDTDGFIVSYEWTQVSGPTNATIKNATDSQTLVTSLQAGAYQFQLTVTDNSSLKSKDIVEVIVNPAYSPQSYMIVTQIGAMSEARAPSIGAAGSKVVFAGGPNRFDNSSTWSNTSPSAIVDIYDRNSQSWTKSQLSVARQAIGVVSCGNKIFFAGGATHEINFNEGAVFDNIDIYDVSTNTWTVAHLSEARTNVATAVLGNKVFFAGGSTDGIQGSKRIDIYDVSTNIWSIAELSDPKYDLDAVVDGDKVYFVGGGDWDYSYNSIDIYDMSINRWSTSTLETPYWGIKNVTVESTKYWIYYGESQGMIKNMATGEITHFNLTFPFCVFSKGSEIIFATQTIPSAANSWNSILVYNTTTREWSRRQANQQISSSAAIISVDNKIYVGGGNIGNREFTDKVYTVSW